MELTTTVAERLARELFADLPDGAFMFLHARLVAKTAALLASLRGMPTDTLVIAGWVHDIGRSRVDEGHAVQSLSILQEKGYVISDTLKDCILNHGSDRTPHTPEGEIIQVADKLSVIDADLLALCMNKDGTVDPEALAFLQKHTPKGIERLAAWSAKHAQR
jgi:HD superfamily phosphodiesterase